MMNETRPDAPQIVADLSGRCITHVKNRTGITLDYESETLSVVDFFINEILKEEGGGAPPKVGDHRRDDVMHLFAPTVGAYFGEMVRNLFPCRWRIEKDDPKSWLIEFEHVPIRFNPVGAAAEAITEADLEEWNCGLSTARGLTDELKERLESAPPVTEEDFFKLSTRFEVIQIAVDWLRARSSENTDTPLNLSKEDYDRLF